MTNQDVAGRVSALLDEGLSDVEIAARLGIAVSRVERIGDELAERATSASPVVEPVDQAPVAAGSALEWADPPRRTLHAGRVQSRTLAILAELQARPGEWACIRDTYSSAGIRWKRRGCEAQVRHIPGSSRVDLYVRWPAPGGDG